MKSETSLRADQLEQFLEIGSHRDSLLSGKAGGAKGDSDTAIHFLCIVERDGTTLFQRVDTGLIEGAS